YIALKDETDERAGGHPRQIWRHVLRPRTILYTALWSAVGVGLIVALFLRAPFGLNVTPVRNPLFVTLADGSIRNTYEVRLRNQQGEERTFDFALAASTPMSLAIEGVEGQAVSVPADATATVRVYVTAPDGGEAALGGHTPIRFWVEDLTSNDRVSANTVFNGMGQ